MAVSRRRSLPHCRRCRGVRGGGGAQRRTSSPGRNCLSCVAPSRGCCRKYNPREIPKEEQTKKNISCLASRGEGGQLQKSSDDIGRFVAAPRVAGGSRVASSTRPRPVVIKSHSSAAPSSIPTQTRCDSCQPFDLGDLLVSQFASLPFLPNWRPRRHAWQLGTVSVPMLTHHYHHCSERYVWPPAMVLKLGCQFFDC